MEDHLNNTRLRGSDDLAFSMNCTHGLFVWSLINFHHFSYLFHVYSSNFSRDFRRITLMVNLVLMTALGQKKIQSFTWRSQLLRSPWSCHMRNRVIDYAQTWFPCSEKSFWKYDNMIRIKKSQEEKWNKHSKYVGHWTNSIFSESDIISGEDLFGSDKINDG